MKRVLILLAAILGGQSLLFPAFGEETAASGVVSDQFVLNGAALSPLWALPFLGIILSIALFPLLLSDFWGKHFGKIALAWAVIALLGIGVAQGFGVSLHSLILVMFEQFLPFICLLLALFTITGGIKMHGQLVGTPLLNTTILLIGAILSSWLGTTGAAVLLIRPLINANIWRKYKEHTVIFFIFIVGNIGGSLTPVGNPPLLMGFISKVPFFWPLTKLLGPTAFATGILLVLYFIMDSYFMKKENSKPSSQEKGSISIEGGWNFALLVAVIGVVMVSSMDMGDAFTLYHVPMPLSELIEIIALLAIAFISVKITRKETREANNFTWHPILEVGKIFAAIFVCMAPLIAMLRAGASGPMSFIINSLTLADGHPANGMYYWLSGGLSAFLDSAPAYLVFFNTAAAPAAAAGMAPHLFMTQVLPATLIAITAGASFMGAITYIGNAPNMMVKAIAEENGIKMPTFFGYMSWSLLILVPLFLLVQFIFI
ncbi:MAG: sodium:proton antiporter [Bacteroidota bacterium]|nr:sodium:proton antiporter [Bacteroidota bacterium]